MISSGMVKDPGTLSLDVNSSRPSTLSESDMKLLEEAYLKLNPQFALLTSEYNKTLMKAVKAREKSTFPCRSK